jgi:AcrR family transcriptional regulator
VSTTSLPPPLPRPMRADARRNYARLLSAASAVFAEQGAEACLEDVAERAGVGIGTLYRHFPTRRSLAEAVFRDQIEALIAQADDLLASPAPFDALATWLRSVVQYSIRKRGLAEFFQTVMRSEGSDLTWCRDAMREAGATLLARAKQAGAVRPDADIADLIRLSHAIALTATPASGGGEQTERLLAIMLDGLRPPEPTSP